MIFIIRRMPALTWNRCRRKSTRAPRWESSRSASRSARNTSIYRWSRKPSDASTASRTVAAPQIIIDRVSHVYRPPRGRPVMALDNVSFEVRDREFVALLGPSGCGKSTLLYLVGGFLPVERGTIRVEDKPIAGPGPDRGIVFQHFALFPWKTVMQNVLYGLEKQGIAREQRLRRAREFINLVGLNGFEDGYPSQLS